jgi:hypothetical protein
VLFDVANNADVDPKQYAVEGGKSITHEVTLESNSDSSYSYFLYGRERKEASGRRSSLSPCNCAGRRGTRRSPSR